MMSSMRRLAGHDPEPDVRSFAVTPALGTIVPPQPPGWDQLLYATTGVMTVVTEVGTWVVPPHRAVWVPSGLDHHIELTGRVQLRSLYLAEGLGAGLPGCRAVNVTPLLRELVLEAVRRAPLWLDDVSDARVIGLLLEQLEALPDAPLQLPMPRDPRALAVADLLRGDTGASPALGLDEVCARAGASRRTVERLFRAETGLGLGEWRTRARLVEAARLLAEGATVTSVAVQVGYATPSAFGAAFRRVLGTTPGRWIEGAP
jgi:AraC-like DNA-binding protein